MFDEFRGLISNTTKLKTKLRKDIAQLGVALNIFTI